MHNEQFIKLNVINDDGKSTYDIILNKNKILYIKEHESKQNIFILYFSEDRKDGLSINITGNSLARLLDNLN